MIKPIYHSGSFTSVINEAKEKGKQTIKLVLRKKPLHIKVLEKLNQEIEDKLERFIEKLIPKMKEVKPDDPEKFLKYMLIQGILNILEQIMEENYLSLTPADKNAVEKMYVNEVEDNGDDKGQINEKKFIPKKDK